MPTFGSLFAGIGGIDLGLERAGWTGRWQVEWDAYCQRVLAQHWPDVPRVGDIHDAHAAHVAHADDRLSDERSGPTGRTEPVARSCGTCLEPVDLIAGGFPCQPFSVAGKRLGKADDRWLWPEFARVVRELRPRYVLVENVPGLLARHGGMGAVLGDLAELGYDAEWDSIPAAAVGAPHLRYRIWIVAWDTHRDDEAPIRGVRGGSPSEPSRSGRAGDVAHPGSVRPGREAALGSPSLAGTRPQEAGAEPHGSGDGTMADADGIRRIDGADGHHPPRIFGRRDQPDQGGWWLTEPDVGRVAHGVPARVDRLRALGNAVVPQVVEAIGRRILEADALT